MVCHFYLSMPLGRTSSLGWDSWVTIGLTIGRSLWVDFLDSHWLSKNQDSGLGSTHQSMVLQETSKKMVKGREIDEKLLRLMDHKYHNQDEKQKT